MHITSGERIQGTVHHAVCQSVLKPQCCSHFSRTPPLDSHVVQRICFRKPFRIEVPFFGQGSHEFVRMVFLPPIVEFSAHLSR